jgi:hypothetical protein
VHGRGFEYLILGVNCDVIRKISKASQTPRKPSRPPGLSSNKSQMDGYLEVK